MSPRLFFIAGCILTSMAAFGQSGDAFAPALRRLFADSVDWKAGWDKTPEERQACRAIIRDSTRFGCTDSSWVVQVESDFHVLDLDADGDRDLVYAGRYCPGYASESVLVYMNTGGAYHLAVEDVGRVVRCGDQQLVVHTYPCCGTVRNAMRRYAILPDSARISEAILFHHTVLEEDFPEYAAMFPEELAAEGPREVFQGMKAYYAPCSGYSSGGMLSDTYLGTIRQAEIVQVYALHRDEEGTTWYYCLVSANNLIGPKHFPHPVMVWVTG